MVRGEVPLSGLERMGAGRVDGDERKGAVLLPRHCVCRGYRFRQTRLQLIGDHRIVPISQHARYLGVGSVRVHRSGLLLLLGVLVAKARHNDWVGGQRVWGRTGWLTD